MEKEEMENQKISIEGGFLLIGTRKLRIKELLRLVNDSERMEEYSTAISRAAFSLAQAASFILTCPVLSDHYRIKGGECFPAQDTYFILQILAENLQKIEKP